MPSSLLASKISPSFINLGSTSTVVMTLYSSCLPINLPMKSTFADSIYWGTLVPIIGTNFEKPNPPAKRLVVYIKELTILVCSAQNVKNLRPLVSRSIR